MALPLYMLKGLQIPLRQKLGLAVLFSLAILSVGFEIARTVINIYGEGAASPDIGRLFNVLEVDLAVIVSNLIPYRALLQKRGNKNQPPRGDQYPQEISKETNKLTVAGGSRDDLNIAS